MRTPIPALLFFAAIPALCQTTPQPSYDPNQVLQLPRQFALAPLDSAKSKVFTFDGNLNNVPMGQFNFPPRTLASAEPHLDDQIIHRPPQASKQQPRTPMAGYLYPGLELLPLKLFPTETARLDPIPVYFPNFKAEPIPTTWPDAKMTLVQSGMQALSSPRHP
jgi:hypothetical protein